MKKVLIVFGTLVLVACDDGGEAAPSLTIDGGEGGVGGIGEGGAGGVGEGGAGGEGTAGGVSVEELGSYGIDCEHEMLDGVLEVIDGYCTPAAPFLKTLIDDCRVIAEAGCRPALNGCAVGAVLSLAAEAHNSNITEIGGTCRQPSANGDIFSIDCTIYFETLNNRPVVGDERVVAIDPFLGESRDCLLNIFDELSPLGQWLFRNVQNPPDE